MVEEEKTVRSLATTAQRLKDPVVVTTAGVEPRILFANEAFARLCGHRPQTLRERTLDFLQGPEEFLETLSHLLLDLSQAGAFLAETTIRRADGSTVAIEWQTAAVAAEGEADRYWFSILRDVSALRRAEADLVEERERADAVLRSVGDAVIRVATDARVEDLNGAAEALTGWRLGEARGKPLSEVFRILDEFSRQPAREPASRCLDAGAPVALNGRCVLLNRHGQEYAVEARAAPIRPLGRAVTGAVLVFRDVTPARRMGRRLFRGATHDALTGLLNRREFERRLENAIAGAGQSGRSQVLCYFDLDHFRVVNESAGRAAGDAVLRQAASLLRARFRERDALARLGGDEFGLLLDNCSLEEAKRLSESVLEAFANARFSVDKRTFKIAPSIGLVAVTSGSGDAAQLLSQADLACYAAKELGRSRIHIYWMDAPTGVERPAIATGPDDVRESIQQNRLKLYYQPIIPLSPDSGLPVHYEFLLRVKLPSGKLVLPRSLIAAAERHGLMAAVDRWVIRTALRHLAEPRGKFQGSAIAINLSGNSLDDPTLVDFVRSQFTMHQISPRLVCFEITETGTIRQFGRAVEVVTDLKRLGCSIALDDFGSGQCSFAYLKALPADFLKIDGGFIRGIVDSPVDRNVVSAINEVGHIMGLKTIAEFAHNRAIVDCLRTLAVDCVQGDAIAPPRPVSARHLKRFEAAAVETMGIDVDLPGIAASGDG